MKETIIYMKKYLISFLLFIIPIAGLIFYYHSNCTTAVPIVTWGIFFYFCILTLLFHFGIVKTTQSRPQVFIRYFMAATSIKLLLHLGVIVVYSITHREHATRFIIEFMIMYLLFTVFEVTAVWRVKK